MSVVPVVPLLGPVVPSELLESETELADAEVSELPLLLLLSLLPEVGVSLVEPLLLSLLPEVSVAPVVGKLPLLVPVLAPSVSLAPAVLPVPPPQAVARARSVARPIPSGLVFMSHR